MEGENLFRWLLLAGFLVGCVIGGYHRIRAFRAGGNVSHKAEGPVMFLALRLTASVGLAGVIAWLIQPQWMEWSSLSLPVSARWAGVPFGALSLALLWWVFNTLGTNLTDTVVTRDRHTLVTTGPYALVRHPFYVTALLFGLAGGLLTANWIIPLTGLAVFVLLAIRSRKEEAMLEQRFGDDYRAYAARTGRFCPRLRQGGTP